MGTGYRMGWEIKKITWTSNRGRKAGNQIFVYNQIDILLIRYSKHLRKSFGIREPKTENHSSMLLFKINTVACRF